MNIALATCSVMPDGWEDDQPLVEELRSRGAGVSFEVWDDTAVQWDRFDRVMIRSTWDYTWRRAEFIEWARACGDRLDNPATVVEWNSDKRYLADLASAGVPTVATTYVEPDDPPPELEGEVVVKPTVSAGARDTGRFGPDHHDDARTLLGRLGSEGKTAMVQPYLRSVETGGETAIVVVEGVESHVLRKGTVLGPDREAPVRDDEIGAAEVMFDPELVGPGSAGEAERAVAAAVTDELGRRFGAAPLYARVDMLTAEGGEAVLLELELVEPTFYLATAPGAERRLAEALLRRAGAG